MSESLAADVLPELPASLVAELQSRPQVVLLLDRRTAQWRELPADAPWRIQQPEDLDPRQVLLFSFNRNLRLTAPVRYGFDLSWIGEAAAGKLQGHLGVPTEALVEARADFTTSGALLCAIWRDQESGLRVRFQHQGSTAAGLAAQASVSAQAQVAEQDKELITAMLEAHPFQWLETLARGVVRGRSEERLVRLFELWNNLERRAAAAIWKAVGNLPAVEALRHFIHQLAWKIEDLAALRSALESSPPAAGSPLEDWITAVAGSLLKAGADPVAFEKLRAAAQAADRLLREETLVQTLAELKQQALEKASAALESAVPQSVRDFLRALREKAREALEKKYTAELSYHAGSSRRDAALLDCSFDFSQEGLGAYRALLGGDLTAALANGGGHVRLHLAVLTHALERQSRLELHLPFLDRKHWSARLEALAQARIEATLDGRLVVYTLAAGDELSRHGLAHSAMRLCGSFVLRPTDHDARFSLGWSDQRRLSPAQARSALPPLLKAYGFADACCWLEQELAAAEQVEAELALAVPGEMAAAWLEAPVERSPDYGPVYTEVSVRVQQAMRRWLPYVYFNDLARYETLGAAYPLVVYQCTLPFRSKTKNEFAYDVMSAESVAVARRSTGWALAAELARIEQLLKDAGKPELARFYRPSRKDVILASVERAPRLLNSLLVADALFIDHLIRLGVHAGGLRRAMEREPQRALRELAKFGEELVKTFHRRLRRLYGGEDFVSFGPLILVEATCGLNGALRSRPSVSGVLRLGIQRRDGRSLERTFANLDCQL